MTISPLTLNRELSLLEELYSLERRGMQPGLETTRELLRRCGNPQDRFPILQIAGTNGKGSTAALTAQILQQHGRKVGLFTSPHLVHFHERIRVSDRCIADSYIARWYQDHREIIGELTATFFEVTTVMALCYFQETDVDIAVLETGMGGRLDATTAAGPTWTALTPIALDHTELLGNTVEAIAKEKVGIMRPGVPCYSAPQDSQVRDVIRAEGQRVNAPVTFVGQAPIVPQPRYLPGVHQQQNAQLAWKLAQEILGDVFDDEQARQAVRATRWPGRYQPVIAQPRVIYDVAHFPHGIQAFLETLRGDQVAGRRRLVLALQEGKHPQRVLELLANVFDEITCTQTGTRHYLPAAQLAALADGIAPRVRAHESAVGAIKAAIASAGDDDLVAILGSHYLGPAVAQACKISFDRLS